MLVGAVRRLLLASFTLLMSSVLAGSVLAGGFLVPRVPRPDATADALASPRLAHAAQASGVECDDPETPCDDRDPGEPLEEIAPESVESDPPTTATAATTMYARLRLCAGVAPPRTAAPREGDSLRRLTVTSSERGPPRV